MRDAQFTDNADAREWARLRVVRDLAGHAVRAHIVGHRFVRHAHPHHTVVLIERGALAFWYRGKDRVAQSGQIALIDAGELHTGSAVDADGCTYASLAVTPQMVDAAARAHDIANPASLRFDDAVVDDRELWWRVARMRNAVCTGAPMVDVRAHAQAALTWLVTQRMVEGVPRVVDQPEVIGIREHIETHYREPLSLRSLGAMVGWSAFKVARVFHAEVGMPVHAYIEMCRVRAACTLMVDGERLSDIAYLAGFPDQAHFTRRFKAIVGLTPGAYARELVVAEERRPPRALRHVASRGGALR